MDTETKTVGTELVSEIERVSAKRERWRVYQRDIGIPYLDGRVMNLGINSMTQTIEAAKYAISINDAARCIQALESLREFSDDD